MATLRTGGRGEQSYPGIDDATLLPAPPTITEGLLSVANYVWDTGALAWTKQTSSGGGGGGAVTQATVPWYILGSIGPVTGAQFQIAGSTQATQGGTWNVGITGTPTVLQGGAPWQVAGSMAATQGGSWNIALLAGAATIGAVTQAGAPWQVAGSVAVTQGGTWTVIAGAGTNSMGSVNVASGSLSLIPSGTQTGVTPFKRISTGDNNAANVKASAGQVYGWSATNVNAAARFLKLYNCGSSPAVGAAIPLITQTIPGNTAGAGNNFFVDTGISGFTSGIAISITAVMADSDNTSISAGDVALTLLYK